MGLCYPEYGRLRKVLVHSPGRELDLISPRTYQKCLFEDAIDQTTFRTQHDAFVEALRREGVDVVLVRELLSRDPELLATIEKHPNMVFTRDTVAVTAAGFISMRMRNPVRRQESKIAEVALQRLGLKSLFRTRAPATMEGGDMVFFDEETILLGVGNRTNWRGFKQLRNATSAVGLHRIVVVKLPGWVIHLDGTMMIVDYDLAVVHPRSLASPAKIYEDGKPIRQMRVLNFLKEHKVTLVEVTDYERKRRATNLIVIGPKRVVGYAHNPRVIKELAKNGVDFIAIEGSELIRGAGGPRCMTAPILRD